MFDLCSGDHIAIFYRCPRRKVAIKQAQEAEEAACILAAAFRPPPFPPGTNALSDITQNPPEFPKLQPQPVAQDGNTKHPTPHCHICADSAPATAPHPHAPNTAPPPLNNPDPISNLGAELLVFAQIAFPNKPVKLLEQRNWLRKNNKLSSIILFEATLAPYVY